MLHLPAVCLEAYHLHIPNIPRSRLSLALHYCSKPTYCVPYFLSHTCGHTTTCALLYTHTSHFSPAMTTKSHEKARLLTALPHFRTAALPHCRSAALPHCRTAELPSAKVPSWNAQYSGIEVKPLNVSYWSRMRPVYRFLCNGSIVHTNCPTRPIHCEIK